ncbi:hypothetical protein TWF694_010234 [Orbilia ellipsospora]|uniref:Uncharacterized protein n=1 Tax=Orbilia ellipsospora TaxID=2528407 RepID=A0AAV9XAM0_9PEZI
MSSILSPARKAAVCRLLAAAADFAGQFDELKDTAEQVRTAIEQNDQLASAVPATDDEDPVVKLLDVAIGLVTSVIVPPEMRISSIAPEEEETDMTAIESAASSETESDSNSQPAAVMADDEDEESEDEDSGFHTSSDMALSDDKEYDDSEIPVSSGATLSSSTRWEDWDDDDDNWVPGILKVTSSTLTIIATDSSELDHALVPRQGDADLELAPEGGEFIMEEDEDSYQEEYDTAEEEFGSQFTSTDEYEDEYEDEYYTYREEDASVGEYYHDDSQEPDNYDDDYEDEDEDDNHSQLSTSSQRSLTADEIRDPSFVRYWQDNFGRIQKFFGEPGEYWDGYQWVWKDGLFYDRHPFTPPMSKYEHLTMNFNSIKMGNGGAPGRFPPAEHASSHRGFQQAPKVDTAEIGRRMRAKLQEWKEEEEKLVTNATPKESIEVQVELKAPTTDSITANNATTTVRPANAAPTDITLDTHIETVIEHTHMQEMSIEPSNAVAETEGAWGKPGLPEASVAADEVVEVGDAGPEADLSVAHTSEGACNLDYGLFDLVPSASVETVQDTGSQMAEGLELVRVASLEICLSEADLAALLDSHDGDRMESHAVDSSSASVENANGPSAPTATTPPTTPNTPLPPPEPEPEEGPSDQAPMMTPLEFLLSRGLHQDRIAGAGFSKKKPIKEFFKTAWSRTNSSLKFKLKVPWKSVLEGLSRIPANAFGS